LNFDRQGRPKKRVITPSLLFIVLCWNRVMKIIAHRGNLEGRSLRKENLPGFIEHVLKETPFDVELDVWYTLDNWYLGHDNPEFSVDLKWLLNNRFWLHAKNGEAFDRLLRKKKANVFYNANDSYALTSKGWIWSYRGDLVSDKVIHVLPELDEIVSSGIYGVCTDYPYRFLDRFKV
jgi:hypothetical protein